MPFVNTCELRCPRQEILTGNVEICMNISEKNNNFSLLTNN